MIGRKKKQRIQLIIIGMVLLVVSAVLIGFGFNKGIQFFRSPSEVAEAPPGPDELFRIGGLVETGSLIDDDGETIRFIVTDNAKSIPVSYTGILPDLFGEGQGVIALGNLRGGTFFATEILAKHDEEYIPKEVLDSLKEQGLYEAPPES